MIYFYVGNNHIKIKEGYNKLLLALNKKKKDATVIRINSDNWDEFPIESLMNGQSLFGGSYIVLLQKTMENTEIKEEIIRRIKEIKASPNIFIFIEENLNTAELKKIENNSQNFFLFNNTEKKGDIKFNVFSIADAFGNRNKKTLWMLYIKALELGIAPEEIHGIIFWQIKSIYLALSSEDATSSGLKPFVYSKSKKYGDNYSLNEIVLLSGNMVSILHESRRGGTELAHALEKLILEI